MFNWISRIKWRIINFFDRPKYKPMSIVTLDDWYLEEFGNNSPFGKERLFLYVGEIKNMRGHGLYIGQMSGKVFSGFHPENFRLPTDDEF